MRHRQPSKDANHSVHNHELIADGFDREMMAELRRRSWRRRTNARTTVFRATSRKPQVPA